MAGGSLSTCAQLWALQPLPRCASNAWELFGEVRRIPEAFFREEKPQFPICRGFLPQGAAGYPAQGDLQCLGGWMR